MKVPKYWAKRVQSVEPPIGRNYKLVSWQWSDASLQDAQAQADARLDELIDKAMSGALLEQYSYSERPLREAITQSITNQSGRENAVVTRNRYGALVLNTADALFIDMDLPQSAPAAAMRALQRKLGVRTSDPADASVERIAAWSSRHPELGLRVYHTAAGLRGLITNELFAPAQSETLDILRELESDPLYVRLCRAQDCFRARLTPKPWRCGMKMPPVRYPFDDIKQEMRFQEWERRYDRAIAAYAVCQFVNHFGPTQVHPDIQPILNLHDRVSGVDAARPLA
ncbi:MAG: hypothetical protein HY741_21220 [Chloroflexi bacterium]|nr:hypothetical protein [Chloroflexota bacterium]